MDVDGKLLKGEYSKLEEGGGRSYYVGNGIAQMVNKKKKKQYK